MKVAEFMKPAGSLRGLSGQLMARPRVTYRAARRNIAKIDYRRDKRKWGPAKEFNRGV